MFYAAFPDSQEHRLRQGGKELGTLPLPGTSARGDVITFAGRRWRIEDINHDKRLVELAASGMGKLPRTGGSGQGLAATNSGVCFTPGWDGRAPVSAGSVRWKIKKLFPTSYIDSVLCII